MRGQKSLEKGKQVHNQIVRAKHEQNAFLGTKLVSMYDKCGSLVDARKVFDKIPERSVFLWNAMIRACSRNDFCVDCWEKFELVVIAGLYAPGKILVKIFLVRI